MGKSFQSNATKFPHPGLHIATKYPKAEPKKGTMKYLQIKLKKRRKIEPKEIASRLIPRLLVVFTWQLEILVTTLVF